MRPAGRLPLCRFTILAVSVLPVAVLVQAFAMRTDAATSVSRWKTNRDIDNAGSSTCAGDVCASSVEICDGVDDDGDGYIDEGCDDDADDWCDAAMTIVGTPSVCPNGGGDCNDWAASTYPGAVEICDGGDTDCDGNVPPNEVSPLEPTIIHTIAGGGPSHLPATEAPIDWVAAVTVAPSGDLYIAAGHRVFRVDPEGILTLVAGVENGGFCGDGGPATLACLGGPVGLSVDDSGNLFIAERWNRRIRRVDTAGTITTVAGNGTAAFCGDGGPATQACIDYPAGVAVDNSGNIYLSDYGHHRIRKVDASGIITTVAGIGWAGYCGEGMSATLACLFNPAGLTLDASGNLFFADTFNQRIMKVNTSGIITTVAGNGTTGFCGDGGPATLACLKDPAGVTVDASGNVFIADAENGRIRKVSTTGTITTVAGNGTLSYCGDGGPATGACLNPPPGVAVNSLGKVYIAGASSNRVRMVNTTGKITTMAGTGLSQASCGDGHPATGACFRIRTADVAVDLLGNLYIGEYARVRKVDLSGTITTVAGNGIADHTGDGGPATQASIGGVGGWPRGLAADSFGNLYLSEGGFVRKVDPSGIIRTVAGNGTEGVCGDGGPATSACLFADGLAVDTLGNLFLADSHDNVVRKVNAAGTITRVAGNTSRGFCGDGGPALSACLSGPNGVAVRGSGDLYIADTGNARVRRVDASGVITTVAGNGIWGSLGDGCWAPSAQLENVGTVAVDVYENVFIAAGTKVRRVEAATGIITTVAGNGAGANGLLGDRGPAPLATLWAAGLAFDPSGRLLISDGRDFQARVRRVVSTPCADPERIPGNPELCDGIDNNCNGSIDEDFDGDGTSSCDGDCDDNNPATFPGHAEICDGLDNDCNGIVPAYEYHDSDGDAQPGCADCNDADATIRTIPSVISNLNVVDVTGGYRFIWSNQSATAGSATVYDAFKFQGSLLYPWGNFSSGSCYADNRAYSSVDYLGPDPPVGNAYYFMFRAQNSCPGGTGSYGNADHDHLAAQSASPCN